MKPLLIAIFLLATACADEPEIFTGSYLTRDGVLFNIALDVSWIYISTLDQALIG